jgi:hypothetical protein
MKRSASGPALLFCICFLCSCASKLTHQQAYQELLKQHSPKLEYIYLSDIQESSAMGNNIKELMAQKSIVIAHNGIPVDVYSILDPNNREIGSVMHNRMKNTYKIHAPVVKTMVGNVIRIVEDKENDMASVLYYLIKEPVEPYYSKLCIDTGCIFYGEGLKKTGTANKFFKKFDKEWRIEP